MAKKKGGGKKKGGKKKKGPAFYTDEQDLAPFGFKLRDIVCTPLGLKGTIIGVKYDPPGPENRDSARLWVEYPGGKHAPLEPKLQNGFIGQAAGYRKVAEAEHIWRDVTTIRTRLEEEDEARTAALERQRLRFEALALEAALADKAKQKKAKKKKPAEGEEDRPQTAPA
mmetsp:Transcript_11552/g.15737  ORF Transcript_11552/g.15737 Transcript_11552/m.15737 type:complete len:169 (+) Transcript_11552:424-930(+)|eukprot:CAMPEP_0196584364 /NCGR_PEP_ID=MMETSP1081-20130531/46792_1 /TAXON_ID=36882 /ORGANISM="Pyramimonas amylifera, Strain CCMP720" /LENGTH=168 /DNA_ID=CAMNT_0041905541 /DNA_START=257 /DNA_END=763 /DNA_ORIENTATION=+